MLFYNIMPYRISAYSKRKASGLGVIIKSAKNHKKKIDVLPDILTNSGGVVVSYYEYLQNKSEEYLSEEVILNKLSKKMEDTFQQVNTLKNDNNTTYRTASYGLALINLEKKYLSDNKKK